MSRRLFGLFSWHPRKAPGAAADLARRRLSLCLAVFLVCIPASAQDAGVQDTAPNPAVALPANPGPSLDPDQSELLTRLQRVTAQVKALTAGTLDPGVNPSALFDVDLNRASALRLEASRLQRLLAAAGSASPDEPAPATTDSADAGLSSTPSQTPSADTQLWLARAELDAARLAFYQMPSAERGKRLADHAELRARVQAQGDEAAQALSRAKEAAEQAEKEKEAALVAAQRATSEAVRLVNEELAHLLDVTQRQADFEQALIAERGQIEERSEAALGWRRRVSTLLGAPTIDTRTADATYAELRTALERARHQTDLALSALGQDRKALPRPNESQLENLPADIDQSAVQRQRTEVVGKVIELEQLAGKLSEDSAQQLVQQLRTLNQLRLSLLPHLSPQYRGRILGFELAGFDQAAAEVQQVVLVLRHHIHLTYAWLGALARSGGNRSETLLALTFFLFKWLPLVALFVWWRRRGDDLLVDFQRKLRQEERHSPRSFAGASIAERGIAFAQKVRRPAEVLLLVHLSVWMLPERIVGILEVQLAETVLSWVFGSRLAVQIIDTWSTKPRLGLTMRPITADGALSLRLKSLYLVSRATVAFGLVLSIGQLLVGRGTVYSWVFSSCWLAAFPIFLTIISWWRPTIFQRLEAQRKKNAFETWALSDQESLRGSMAAIAGGVYLFAQGVVRATQVWVANFRIIRRLLAYLFRRDLNKKSQDAAAPCGPLDAAVFDALGPDAPSDALLDSVLRSEVREVSERVVAKGGSVIAVVGERGSGKSTLVAKLSKGAAQVFDVRCTPAGLGPLKEAICREAGLNESLSLNEAVAQLDQSGRNTALLLDDAGLLMKPVMGGLKDLDTVLDLCRRHSSNCTWILAFDHSLWRFIKRARAVRPMFDEVLTLHGWSEEDIGRLLMGRNKRHGIVPNFEHMSTSLAENTDEIDRLEAMRRTEMNYYRLLWDYSDGNPSVALHFWRRSLGVTSAGDVTVQFFDPADADDLESLPDAAVFVLRAIVQLGWASVPDVQLVTSLAEHDVHDVLRYGSLRGFFEQVDSRYRLTWDWYRAVTRMLRRRHLLSSNPV